MNQQASLIFYQRSRTRNAQTYHSASSKRALFKFACITGSQVWVIQVQEGKSPVVANPFIVNELD
jgi:hypothetical protein